MRIGVISCSSGCKKNWLIFMDLDFKLCHEDSNFSKKNYNKVTFKVLKSMGLMNPNPVKYL